MKSYLKFITFVIAVLSCAFLASCKNSGKNTTVTQNQDTASETTTSHTHTYSDEWSYDEHIHYHACTSGDDSRSDASMHTFDDGVIVKEATAKETGEKKYTCTVCGYSYSEEIEKTISYTVKFLNYNGEELQVLTELEPGVIPSYTGDTPTRESDDTYYYTFIGWDEEIIPVVSDYVYYAKYEKKVDGFTITWKNYDGAMLSTEEYKHGQTPSFKGETPTKGSTNEKNYTFIGWDKEITSVEEDATYTAQFEESTRYYTIEFKNEDGTILQTNDYTYGETPTFEGNTPTKESTNYNTYEFVGWDNEITKVDSSKTYTATFKESTRYFTVEFKNEDGTVLQSNSYTYGETPSYTGDTPTKASVGDKTYLFDGWDKEITDVTSDETYTAVFIETKIYTITFKNYDGTVLSSIEIATGRTPEYNGETPTKESTSAYTYEFSGWDKEISPAKENTIYTAVFEEKTRYYKVEFLNFDGTLIQSYDFAYEEVPSYSGDTPVRAKDESHAYRFKGWDKEFTAVESDQTYTAVYNEYGLDYKVTFKDYDGTILKEEGYAFEDIPSYTGDAPTRESTNYYTYEFIGWDKEFTAVESDQTYIAQYKESTRYYKIEFVNYDGTILQSNDYTFGTLPAYSGDTPVRADDTYFTYSFYGWDSEITGATSNKTYTAVYKETRYRFKVYFDINGGTSDSYSESKEILSIDSAIFPTDVKKSDYVFKGWMLDDTLVVDENGNILQTITLTNEMTFKAYFEQLIHVTMTITPSSLEKEISGAGSYERNTEITLKADASDTKISHFVGFYINNVLLSSESEYKYNVGTSDAEIEARYEYGTTSITIETYDKDYGLISVDYGVKAVDQETVTFDQYYFSTFTISVTTKNSIRFTGWWISEDGETAKLVSSDSTFSYTPDGSVSTVKITAKYDAYKIYYVVDSDTTVESPSIFTSTDSKVTYSIPEKEGYEFVGWTNTQGSTTIYVIDNTKVSYLHDFTLYPIFTARKDTPYTVRHMLSLGDGSGEYKLGKKESLTGTTDALTSAKSLTFFGYTVIDGFNQETIKANGSTVVYIYYSANVATISVKTDPEDLLKQNVAKASSTSVAFGNELTLTAKDTRYYAFKGWYLGDTLVSDEIEYTGTYTQDFIENVNYGSWYIEYTAKFYVPETTITLQTYDGTTIKTSTVTWGNVASFGIKKYSSDVFQTHKFIGWSLNGTLVTDADGTLLSYWNLKDTSVTLKATYESIDDNGTDMLKAKRFYMGSYAQTLVTSDSVKEYLNALWTDLPTTTNLNDWDDMMYIVKSDGSYVGFYREFDIDADGLMDYAAIYFNAFKPMTTTLACTAVNSLVDDNGYEINTVYYFTFEAVEWRVRAVTDYTNYITYELNSVCVLDSTYFSAKTEGQGANNYSSSGIHNFVRGIEQYATDEELDVFIKMYNYNDATEGKNNWTWTVDRPATYDYVYLESYNKAYEDKQNGLTIIRPATDFAKCAGVKCTATGAYYYLRTPDTDDFHVSAVSSSGEFCVACTYDTYYGMAPSICVEYDL